jgi:DNA recombination protein RmuC
MNPSIWLLLGMNCLLLLFITGGIILWLRRIGNMQTAIGEMLRPLIVNHQSDLTQFSDAIKDQLQISNTNQFNQLRGFQNELHHLIQMTDKRLELLATQTGTSLHDLRQEICLKLDQIRQENNSHLERMRQTVDEKLHKTLENRLGQSFKLVSDSLERVQQGLGEMQSLATGVGDLKRVLSNVKTRGILGEIQLGSILEQILSPGQYEMNVRTIPASSCHVEFAIKFPGKEDHEKHIWLPIDAKFPLDMYEHLLQTYEEADAAEISRVSKQVRITLKQMARDIRTKYISPPHTTDFGILFLPVEGLYAEVVRQPGLVEELQREYRIMVAGPTNLAAFLNSLQMGFQSLAIERRSSEVWKILSSVKTEFSKFGDILSKTQKKLQEASNVIDKAGVRSRAIERSLRGVEELSPSESHAQVL